MSRVTLQDCADEPIHTPGSIQPHGALLVFDHFARLVARSANAPSEVAGLAVPEIGVVAGPDALGGIVGPAVARRLGEAGHTDAVELRCGSDVFDVVMHDSDGLLLVELERRQPEAMAPGPFGHLVHGVSARLQQQAELTPLLDTAVRALRDLTRFDRVMAYRFLPDGSGEVVAEERRADLEPFFGLRYPATDIPAQARRLYALNRIRAIPDVGYTPVPIEPSPVNPRTRRPIDMSHCMLRSVSPIHVEYLQNMGVGASMSISLMVGGRLWGLIAFHHMGPHRPSYNVRMACLVLAETLSLLVAQADELARYRVVQRCDRARGQIVVRARQADDLVRGVIEGTPNLLDVVKADGAAVVLGGRIATIADVPPRERIKSLVDWLQGHPPATVHALESAAEWPDAADHGDDWAGVLAAEFFRDSQGYLLWFRRQQILQVRWAGDPTKHYGEGPNGARLTPRGSFAEWTELARGHAEPWLAGERDAAQHLREELQRIALQKTSQLERVHSLLIGVLGHDLRTPLHAIALSAAVLAETDGGASKTIMRSTSRMSALIDSMLDYAQLENRGALAVRRETQDLHSVVAGIVDEAIAAFPGCDVGLTTDGDPIASFDKTRIGQLLSNLLSNARHHGDPTQPISVRVDGDSQVVRIEVQNHGDPIPDDLFEQIFDAFRSHAAKRSHHRVGLGLFICRAIANAHDGTIDARCADGVTTFVVQMSRYPRAVDAAAT
ncbi:MAG: GAF domain-containing protein [Planctomycetota bacterium]